MTSGIVLDNGIARCNIATFAGLLFDVFYFNKDDGAKVGAWVPTGLDNQRWIVFPVGTPVHPDEVAIFAGHNGKALSTATPTLAEAVPSTPIITWTWRGGDNQRWRLVKRANGSTGIVASRRPELTFDLDGGSGAQGQAVILWTPHNGDNQGFTLAAV